MLSKGEEWDWLGDPFWRVQTLLIVFVLALAGLFCRELTVASPVVNFRVLRERNFAVSCGITFGALAVLYAASVALPLLLLTLFGYDAYAAGLVLWPAGIFATLILLVVGRLLCRGIDARWLIAPGLLIMAVGNYWMALMNLYISPSQAIWPRVVTIIGLSLLFAPLNVAAFLFTPKHLRGAAVGLLALLRNEGGSFGTSMVQTLQERRNQFHTARAGEFLDPFNPEVSSSLEQTWALFYQQTGDPAGSQQVALQVLADLRRQQAASFAYFDVFWVAAAASLGLVFLVFLMKRSVAEKNPNQETGR
jgi:DHA2 family multidrug resistance protein